jgi:hypothetical protein
MRRACGRRRAGDGGERARRFCDECAPVELRVCLGEGCAARKACGECRGECLIASDTRELKRRRMLENAGTLWTEAGEPGGEAARRSARLRKGN